MGNLGLGMKTSQYIHHHRPGNPKAWAPLRERKGRPGQASYYTTVSEARNRRRESPWTAAIRCAPRDPTPPDRSSHVINRPLRHRSVPSSRPRGAWKGGFPGAHRETTAAPVAGGGQRGRARGSSGTKARRGTARRAMEQNTQRLEGPRGTPGPAKRRPPASAAWLEINRAANGRIFPKGEWTIAVARG